MAEEQGQKPNPEVAQDTQESAQEERLPTSKVDRASRFFRTGAKIGGNYIRHYGKRMIGQESSQADLDKANASDMFESFSELKGGALKVAQMLSMDNINFSSDFTNVMQKAQYSVPPMSVPLARKTFAKSIGQEPEQVFDQFDPKAVKAASMGQVHKAEKDGVKMAVKIQYPGVADSIKSDLGMVRGMAQRVMGVTRKEIDPYFKEVEDKLMEESDYRLELKTSMEFAEACKSLEGVVFPKYYPELSGDRVITMQWIDGKHLKEFLAGNPSSELRHQVARNLWDYYEFQIHELRRLNSDPHPGNFLFRKDGTIGVLDFGCTKSLTEQLYNDYFEMAKPNLFEDEERAMDLLERLEILRPNDTAEKRAQLFDLFRRLIQTIALPYHQGYFNFADKSYYDRIQQISMELKKLRELRGNKDFLFINRTYFGLFALFSELNVELNTTCQYHDFVDPKLQDSRAGREPVKD